MIKYLLILAIFFSACSEKEKPKEVKTKKPEVKVHPPKTEIKDSQVIGDDSVKADNVGRDFVINKDNNSWKNNDSSYTNVSYGGDKVIVPTDTFQTPTPYTPPPASAGSSSYSYEAPIKEREEHEEPISYEPSTPTSSNSNSYDNNYDTVQPSFNVSSPTTPITESKEVEYDNKFSKSDSTPNAPTTPSINVALPAPTPQVARPTSLPSLSVPNALAGEEMTEVLEDLNKTKQVLDKLTEKVETHKKEIELGSTDRTQLHKKSSLSIDTSIKNRLDIRETETTLSVLTNKDSEITNALNTLIERATKAEYDVKTLSERLLFTDERITQQGTKIEALFSSIATKEKENVGVIFYTLKGSCPANSYPLFGQETIDDSLVELVGNTMPNFSGLFIRNISNEVGLGVIQDDTTAVNNLKLYGGVGNQLEGNQDTQHTHPLLSDRDSYGWYRSNISALNIIGDKETRPKNVSLLLCIKGLKND